jgi:hypothetical protein
MDSDSGQTCFGIGEGGGGMRAYLLEKVRVKLRNRLLWAAVIAERGGVSLLFVKRPDEQWRDLLVFAAENLEVRCFEPVHASRFELEAGDIMAIGGTLVAIAEGLSEGDGAKFFNVDDLL